MPNNDAIERTQYCVLSALSKRIQGLTFDELWKDSGLRSKGTITRFLQRDNPQTEPWVEKGDDGRYHVTNAGLRRFDYLRVHQESLRGAKWGTPAIHVSGEHFDASLNFGYPEALTSGARFDIEKAFRESQDLFTERVKKIFQAQNVELPTTIPYNSTLPSGLITFENAEPGVVEWEGTDKKKHIMHGKEG